MYPYKQTFLSLIALILFFYNTAAWSIRDYYIELVIFKYTNIDQYNSEKWLDNWLVPNTDNSLDLNNISPEKQDMISSLKTEEKILTGIAETLDESGRYQLLAHYAWRQPGLNKDDAIDIKIQAGQAYRRLTPLPDPEPLQNEEPKPEVGSLFVVEKTEDTGLYDSLMEKEYTVTVEYELLENELENIEDYLVYELSGNFKFVVSRFIHIYTNLLLMQPVTLELTDNSKEPDVYAIETDDILLDAPKFQLSFSRPETEFTTLHGFSIKAHRRMRSNELHFIDHPMLGMIVKAWPAPEKEEDEEKIVTESTEKVKSSSRREAKSNGGTK